MTPTLLSLLLLSASGTGDLVAIRVKRAETVAQGPIEHALILVEDGKIIEIGEDLPLERGIPVIERPDWVATPGFIDCHTRVGAERVVASRTFDPQAVPELDIDPTADAWAEVLELGVTTLGFYPEGSGIPGQAIALRPRGDTLAEMRVAQPAYLKINLQASASSKNMLREAFKKADEYEEKVAKEREKWEKEQEKKKPKAKAGAKKEEEPKPEEKKEEEKKEGGGTAVQQEGEKKADEKAADAFVPSPPDERVRPFLDLRAKKLTAMMALRKAADYLHLLDVIEDEKELQWFVFFPLQDDIDFYEVAPKMGEKKLLVVTQPDTTLQPNSIRERNIPAELARAGAKLAFVPRQDSLSGLEEWRTDVGRLIGQGLARDAALAGLTLEGARALGLQETLGSLEKDKVANIVFWSDDPFEPAARVQAVMLEGEFVYGEVK